jgi:D-lactate dehydrogenase (cytochrome)
MASRAVRLFTTPTRLARAGTSRVVFRRRNSTSASPRPSTSSWSPTQVVLLTLAIGGAGFAAGIAYNKPNHHDTNYSRACKFPAPEYGRIKDMQAVRANQHAREFVR